MNREEVSEIVCEYADVFGPTNRPERKKVEARLRYIDKIELFEGLYALFLLPDGLKTYARQQNAGVILYKLKPRVHLELKQRIRILLDTWNPSVEQLPFYLTEKCGTIRMLKVLDELKLEPLKERERAALDTLTYWVKRHEI